MDFLLLPVLVFFFNIVLVSCSCENGDPIKATSNSSAHLLRLKLTAMGAILISGTVGVSLPLLGRRIRALNPGSDIFFLVKAFAGGVILATGFIHVLPDAFDLLSSPCIPDHPWKSFPFAGLVAMTSAIATMAVDSIATGVYSTRHLGKGVQVNNAGDVEDNVDRHAAHMHVHTHATHGHAHGASTSAAPQSELLRKRMVSKVLELGILAHSVVIGISLGASESTGTVRPLLVALCFHQFFEGVGLGGCISQAKFEDRSAAVMAAFFSLTTPAGVGLGMGLTNVYNENGAVAMTVEGLLNSASAGILIYMALVDLLAADFMAAKSRSDLQIQLSGYLSLLLGAASMSALAIWA